MTEEEKSEHVMLLAASGVDRRSIAGSLGISVAELNEKYKQDMHFAGIRVQGMMLKHAYDLAASGSISAVKFIHERANLQAPIGSTVSPPCDSEGPKERKVAYIGKKEAELISATKAHEGTDWASLVDPDTAN